MNYLLTYLDMYIFSCIYVYICLYGYSVCMYTEMREVGGFGVSETPQGLPRATAVVLDRKTAL